MDNPELEGSGLGGQQDGDGSEGHADHHGTVGRNLTNRGFSATFGGKPMSA
jgi:hypothetical protein